ncbi:type IV pilus modification protein PilV [Aquipseudomonas ullengensis]|uniref:Type IV pilus modification protein PilV n=1 Tax=Aquipseudomonas ullengensis TaxID=2759166 RepID=A0A7W4LLL7_9GAMM|nr:type IV pilus modification protein PilV [Pseudomonas ullengensis]MBB2495409.1 type IV pilus modification protein PilV [Pseudomonas ullengensis]
MRTHPTLRSHGFTLIEVMVALVVLAVGLLGMASLMVRSQQSNESAYARSQATLLAYDIIERMRTNKLAYSALESRKVSFATQNSAYALSALPNCATPATGTQAVGSARAAQDLAQWCASVRTNLPSVVPGQTSIVRGTGAEINTYTVNIAWLESSQDTQFVRVEAEL